MEEEVVNQDVNVNSKKFVYGLICFFVGGILPIILRNISSQYEFLFDILSLILLVLTIIFMRYSYKNQIHKRLSTLFIVLSVIFLIIVALPFLSIIFSPLVEDYQMKAMNDVVKQNQGLIPSAESVDLMQKYYGTNDSTKLLDLCENLQYNNHCYVFYQLLLYKTSKPTNEICEKIVKPNISEIKTKFWYFYMKNRLKRFSLEQYNSAKSQCSLLIKKYESLKSNNESIFIGVPSLILSMNNASWGMDLSLINHYNDTMEFRLNVTSINNFLKCETYIPLDQFGKFALEPDQIKDDVIKIERLRNGLDICKIDLFLVNGTLVEEKNITVN